MTPWLLATLAVFATARLTRVVTTDAVADRPRKALVDRLGDDSKLVYFIHCPWCVSTYVGAGVAAAAYWAPCAWWVQWPLLALTASYLTGILATRVEP